MEVGSLYARARLLHSPDSLLEDVAGVVIELGSTWIKAGYAGEESPKTVIPARIGTVERDESKPPQDYYVGDVNIHTPRANMSLQPFLKEDGSLQDTNATEALFHHIFHHALRFSPSETPILLSEPMYLNKTARDKMIELLFEKFHIPGLHLDKDAVLAAFSQAKSSCLVVDLGGAHASVTPVIDGYVLKGAAMHQPFAGHALTDLATSFLQDELSIALHSHYEIATKQLVSLSAPPNVTLKPFPSHTTLSFKQHAKFRIAQDFKEAVCQVSETKYKAV